MCLEYFSIDAIIGYDFILLFYPVIAFFCTVDGCRDTCQ